MTNFQYCCLSRGKISRQANTDFRGNFLPRFVMTTNNSTSVVIDVRSIQPHFASLQLACALASTGPADLEWRTIKKRESGYVNFNCTWFINFVILLDSEDVVPLLFFRLLMLKCSLLVKEGTPEPIRAFLTISSASIKG